jgi:lipoprotein-releasing system ATP-binding protein
MVILQAQDIYKSYNDLPVLKGVNLSVEKNEIVSVVGASGAGKSTLLHIMGALDTPDRGTLKVMNTNIHKYSTNQLANFRNQEIGFVFQFHNLLPEFTALENVCIPGYIAKSDTKEVIKRGEEVLKILGLTQRKDHKPSELSGGEQQRVAVARALINQPSIVFADEPSGNLDSKNADELHQLFFKLRDEFDQTFVIVTHNNELATMADRKLEMVDGVIAN